MTDRQKLKSYRDDIKVLKARLSRIKELAGEILFDCESALADIQISEDLRRAKPKPKRVKK
jgi:hypothetical protein